MGSEVLGEGDQGGVSEIGRHESGIDAPNAKLAIETVSYSF